LILSSGAKYNQINFSKNYVSGNARKIGVTFIWWFTIEVIPIEKCYQLSENVLVLIHMQSILAAKIQKSSPLTQKFSVTNYISIISKNA